MGGRHGASGNGAADGAADALASFAQDVVLMRAVGILPVVVHGGGPQIGELMARLGKETEFRDGLRVTDAETLDIARMVLVGKVNRDIVSAINVHGPLAVGMSGEDANLITAAQSHVDLGFVGHVSEVDPTMLQRLVAEGIIPVVATIGADEAGQAYNINADTVAGALAEALQAEKLIFLTDVEGLRVVPDDPTTLIHQANLDVVAEILRGGGAVGGMKPKIEACAQAVRGGVGPGPHPRRACAACAPARAVHRLGRRDDGAAVSADPPPTPPSTAAPSCAPTPSHPSPSCGVRAPCSTTPPAGSTSTSSPGWPSCRSATAHPVVAEAVATQARTLSHVSNLYGNTIGPEVALTIDRLINGGTGQAGGQVFFANSGAEANECALKLARRWAGAGAGTGGGTHGTSKHVVISADNSFHGRTLATLTATGQPEKHAPFRPLPEGFVHVPYDDIDGPRCRARRRHRGRGPARAPAGRGRRHGAELGLPGRRPRPVHRAQRSPHARRGADRPGPHRPLVRLPGPGAPARRGHHGQGARQRDAGRRLLGPGRGGGRLRAR